MRYTIVVLVLLAVAVSAQENLCKCGDKGQDIGPCKVNFHACGCLKHLTKWEYECTAKDKETGTSGDARWYKSDKGACEHAVVPLFANHNSTNCNCQSGNVPVGKCTFEMKACWFFQNTDQIAQKNPVLKFFARDPQTGVTGYSCCFPQSQAEQGGQAAVQSLGRQEDLTKCFTAEEPQPITSEEWDAVFAQPATRRSLQASLPLMP